MEYIWPHTRDCRVSFQRKKKKMPRSSANSGVTVYLASTGYHNSLSDLITRPPFSDALGNKLFSPFGGDEPPWRLESSRLGGARSQQSSAVRRKSAVVRRTTSSQRNHGPQTAYNGGKRGWQIQQTSEQRIKSNNDSKGPFSMRHRKTAKSDYLLHVRAPVRSPAWKKLGSH